jgi:RNA polymerase sigma factor (sigma-70 family)
VDIDDVVSEVTVKFLEGLHQRKYETHLNTLGSYLYKMTYFTSIDSLKKKRSLPESYQYHMEQNEISDIDTSYRQELMLDALESLPNKYKNVLEKYYYRDLSLKEIAEENQTTDKYIKRLLYEGRKRLKQKICEQSGKSIDVMFA